MIHNLVRVDGRRYVPVPVRDYEGLRELAAGTPLPELPKPDRSGNVPALEYIRASIARDLISKRLALGLTRAQLAKLARVRVTSIERLESGEYRTSPPIVDKIHAVLTRLAKAQRRARKQD